MKSVSLDIVIMNETLFKNMMSSGRVMLLHISCIPNVISSHATIDAGDELLAVFLFSYHMFGPNISSDDMVSSAVTGKSDSWLPLILLDICEMMDFQ